MKDRIKQRLGAGAVLLDGGLATELERRGADLRDALWSARLLIDQPELIRDVHVDYLRAGSQIITTASYQASVPGFVRRGLSFEDAERLLRRSVDLAKEACERFVGDWQPEVGPLVAASIGPFGAFLADGSEYSGKYELSISELRAWHQPRFDVLARTDADFLAFETIPCLAEAEAIVDLLRGRPDALAWVSFSCNGPAALRTDESLAEAAKMLAGLGNVVAVGVNCIAPGHALGAIATLESALPGMPIVVYPNTGEGWDATTKTWVGETTPFDWSHAARLWRDAGASLLGGCCRTTPDTIRAMAKGLAERPDRLGRLLDA